MYGKVKNQALFLNSTRAKSKNLSQGSAVFEMNPPLHFNIEGKGHSPEIAVHGISFVNFFINISASIGNNHIYYSDDALDDTKYDIKISDGCYSVETLNIYVTKAQAEQVGQVIFQLLPNNSTNGTYIVFGSVTGWYVYFQAADTPYSILGWNSGDYVPSSKSCVVNEIEESPNSASFAIYTSINVWTNLSNSTYFGGEKEGIIYESRPIAPIGSVQLDQPNNLLWADSPELTSDFTIVTIQLRDQNGDPVDTNGEDFSVTLQIRS